MKIEKPEARRARMLHRKILGSVSGCSLTLATALNCRNAIALGHCKHRYPDAQRTGGSLLKEHGCDSRVTIDRREIVLSDCAVRETEEAPPA